jgi:acetoin utilization protein AcuC
MKEKNQTAILYSNRLREYDFGKGHPFRGDRYDVFMQYFRDKFGKTWKIEIITKDKPATDEDLLLWHRRDYIQAMRDASLGIRVPNLAEFISFDNVNPITGKFPLGIEEAARVIVKNSMLACELVQERKYDKVISLGGGLHHARPRYGEGFCVYNDVVISIRHVIKKYGLERVLVLDTDAHAGNGTCEAFYSDPRILFIDLHQRGIYPGTGYAEEVGAGEGEGLTINVPMPPYASDEAYRAVFDEVVCPLAEEFNPQIVFRNGGSDPHPSDGITQLGLTLEGFKMIGEKVREIANLCDGKEVDLICSGYRLEVLSRAWSSLISGLTGMEGKIEEPLPLEIEREQMLEETKRVVGEVKRNLKSYWKCMKG